MPYLFFSPIRFWKIGAPGDDQRIVMDADKGSGNSEGFGLATDWREVGQVRPGKVGWRLIPCAANLQRDQKQELQTKWEYLLHPYPWVEISIFNVIISLH